MRGWLGLGRVQLGTPELESRVLAIPNNYAYKDTRTRCCFEGNKYFSICIILCEVSLVKRLFQVLTFSLIEEMREVEVFVNRLYPEHIDHHPPSHTFSHNTCFYRLSCNLQSYTTLRILTSHHPSSFYYFAPIVRPLSALD